LRTRIGCPATVNGFVSPISATAAELPVLQKRKA
jgi:hypothetical protein